MSVIWSGITEEGAVVPVQVTEEGKVVATGDGPQGDYLPITGGELTGDLEVDGSITAAGDVKIGGLSSAPNITLAANGRSTFYYPSAAPTDGVLKVESNVGGTKQLKWFVQSDGTQYLGGDASSAPNILLKSDGNITAAGSLTCKNYVDITRSDNSSALQVNKDGQQFPTFKVTGDGSITADGEAFFGNSNYYNKFYTSGTHEIYNTDWPTSNNALDIKGSTGSVFTVLGNGSIAAARGKCGFTADGELIFSSRGTRYKLFVSQGVCQAEEYTRQMELKEKAEQFIADKRETKPSTQPSKPSTQPQPEATPDNDNA